ncbi:MAG: LemA family protein [Methylocystis sp.]|uniref:LemA family protein n=1 Tax=Methylocystis sp. TaxID=1911079 RepID=UPI003DA5DB23
MIVACVALVLFALAAALLLGSRRRLLALDAQCDAAAAEVEAELSRLHAFLPPLVGLMRAFAPAEREAVEIVARAHVAAQRAPSPQARLLAETRLADGVHELIARAQGVGPIRSLQDFSALRVEMEEAERRLLAARRRLSAATHAYNEALGRFPESLFAMRLGLAPRAFYDIGVERMSGEEMA